VPKLCPKIIRNIKTYLTISKSIEIQNALKTASFQWNYIIICTLSFSAASDTFPFDQDVLARAYAKLGNIDKAIEAYQKLLTFDPKGQDRRMRVPIYHYRLAKVYDAKGLKEQARAEYRKLLEDWKDADSGIPELTDAKKRLGSSP
jgi:pentatricopeptide repeat protein